MTSDFNNLHDPNGGQNQKRDDSQDNRNMKSHEPDGMLPEDDPSLINPDELATFPKQKQTEKPDIEEERHSHHVNIKSSPARDGRNITRTGPTTDRRGFM